MLALVNSTIGILFLVLAMGLTFLMFYIWKFPYDKATHKTTAPLNLVRLHRVLGYLYVIIYIYLMWQMVPRLWAYQIELPARTVFHLTLGMSIGAILVTKINIVRFFRHMEAKLVPFLGTALLICTMLLIFLALPFSLREAYLSNAALDGDDEMMMQRIERVRQQLPKAGIEDLATIDRLASREGLIAGRNILQGKCTQCHDLRTVLARPRTPDSWKQTVARMANRSTILNPIDQQDQLAVTAYLIAISPTLQKTLIARREQAQQNSASQHAGDMMAKKIQSDGDMDYDEEVAEGLLEQKCTQCHGLDQVEDASFGNKMEVVELVQRMITNGLVVDEDEVSQIVGYLSDYNIDEDAGATTGALEQPDAGAVVEGELLFSQFGCSGCHGLSGEKPIVDNYPKISGLGQSYLKTQIRDIRDGARANGSTAVMQGAIQGISDHDIEKIAQFLSQ